MPNNAQKFRTRLAKTAGLSDAAIEAAWPDWWSEAADASPSAHAELRFSLARKLGLDPRSLLGDGEPAFLWDDSAKYKNFTGDVSRDKPIIASYGISIGRMLCRGTPTHQSIKGLSAGSLRASILARQLFVRFEDLIGLLWAIGIPTIHLRVYPLAAKHMCAMAVSIEDRHAILVAKDSLYPAWASFHLAHEIGHIALGHIAANQAIVDMDDPTERQEEVDEEELAADRFALELLTGDPDFKVEKSGRGRNARQLAEQALAAGPPNNIEPGTLALCYGHVTKEWGTVQKAMTRIYSQPAPVWQFTNKVANKEIDWDLIGDDNENFLRAVMGGVLN